PDAASPSRRLSSLLMGGLRVERDGDVLRVTLARPERRNAFDAQLIADLTAAFSDVGDARAVVLAGEGETFCAGADIEWQRSAIVEQLLSSGPKAVRAAKDLIRERPDGRKTAEIAARMRTSDEGQQRLRAFFERRT